MKARTGYVYADCEACGKQIDSGVTRQRGQKYCECGKQQRAAWWCRFTFVGKDGVRHNIRRRAENKSGAKVLLRQLLRECDDGGGETLLSAHKRFDVLADQFKAAYLTEPVYVDGKKVSGLRSYLDQRRLLKTLRLYFGATKLRDITAGRLVQFKNDRLKAPKQRSKGQKRGGQRAIASVNRELALLRRMLNVAKRDGWILRSPFEATDKGFISTDSEKKRERILTRDEEARLLAACTNANRKHGLQQRVALKPIIICALDTGMRKGEILKLKWVDVDFDNGSIIVRAFNTKTSQERELAMTKRLKLALEAVYELSSKDPDALCFGITDNVKKSFDTVRRDAGLPDVRFHDLRHTAATKLIARGLALPEVGRILGHNQPKTTYRYINLSPEAARRGASALDEYNAEGVEPISESVN